jgi:hypothetical protein
LLKFRYIVEELTGDFINSANAWLLISTRIFEKAYFFSFFVRLAALERRVSHREQGVILIEGE